MFRRFSTNFAVFSIFLDGLLIALSCIFRSSCVSGPIHCRLCRTCHGRRFRWCLYLLFPLVWVLVLLVFNIYDGRKNIRVVDEFGSLTLACGLASVTSAGILYFTFRDISRFQFGLFALLAILNSPELARSDPPDHLSQIFQKNGITQSVDPGCRVGWQTNWGTNRKPKYVRLACGWLPGR